MTSDIPQGVAGHLHFNQKNRHNTHFPLVKIFAPCYNHFMSKKDVAGLLKHWFSMADYDIKTAQNMFDAKFLWLKKYLKK